MTSNPLFSKTGRADRRRDIGFFVSYVILFFFVLPVSYLFRVADYMSRTVPEGITGSAAQAEWHLRQLQDLHNYTLSRLGMGAALVLLVIVALAEAYHQFGYLHRAREVDLYHGLPQTRRQIFFARFRNGLFFGLVPYAVSFLLGILCAAVTGNGLADVLPALGVAFVLNVFVYLLAFSVAVTAVMLTGQAFTGIAGMGVLFGYSPTLSLFFSSLPSTWFRTYAGRADWFSSILSVLTRLSPVTYAVDCAVMFQGRYSMPFDYNALRGWSLLRVFSGPAAACLFLVLSLKLYEMRQLERASEAMAFPKTERPVRIALSFLAALAGAAFMQEMAGSFGWAVFGMLCALVIAHYLVEFVYRTDIRKIFSHKAELAAMAAVCVLLLLSFRFDWYGFDRYVPRAENVEAVWAEISMNEAGLRMDCMTEDGEVTDWFVLSRENIPGLPESFSDPEDVAAVIALSEAGVAELPPRTPRSVPLSWFLRGDEYGYACSTSEYDPDEETSLACTVRYTLKSGETRSRVYFIRESILREKIAPLFNGREFRSALFPLVYSDLWDNSGRVIYGEYGFRQEIAADGKEALLAAYRDDAENVSWEEIEAAEPAGFLYVELPRAYAEKQWSEIYGTVSPHMLYVMRCPVYRCFEKTMGILSRGGIEPGTNNMFLKTDTLYYTLYTEDGQDGYRMLRGEITGPEDLAVLRGELIDSECYECIPFPEPVMADLFLYSDGMEEGNSAVVPENERTRAIIEKILKGEQ